MKGLIHIYCGEGKGKTTAALGLMMRASASGFQIIFAQFMKAWDTGELETLYKLDDVTVLRGDFPAKFSNDYTMEERTAVILENNRLFREATTKVEPMASTLLVLDEIIGSMDKGLMDNSLVIDFLKKKDMNMEVVMTGRNPSDELIELADYVSEIKKIKHPYEKGIKARKGIEY